MGNKRRARRGNVITGRFGQPRGGARGPSDASRTHADEVGRDELRRELTEAEQAVARALMLCAGDGRAARVWVARCLTESARPDLAKAELRKLLHEAIDRVCRGGWL